MKIKLAPWMLRLAYKVVDIESLGEASVFEGRTLEYGFAVSRLSKLIPGKLLDVGCTARINPIPSTMCEMGWNVTGLDIRDYNFAHPRFTFKKGTIEDEPSLPTFDAITCISTLEHIGLKRYGGKEDFFEGDLIAIRKIIDILKPKGTFILTVPYTKLNSYTTNLERVYDDKSIEYLTVGLKLTEKVEHPNLLLTSWIK